MHSWDFYVNNMEEDNASCLYENITFLSCSSPGVYSVLCEKIWKKQMDGEHSDAGVAGPRIKIIFLIWEKC